MFTGIVEELGTVEVVEDQGDAIRLTIRAATVLDDAGLGDSIAVNGCCLTVADAPRNWTADVMQETLDKTACTASRPGDRVNLERAVTAETRLGGHIVQGHVDGVGQILRPDPQRALGGRRHPDARRPGPLPRRQGLDHRRRRQPDRRRGSRGRVHRQPDPRDAAAHDAGIPRARGPGEPRGRRDRQVRRAAARRELRDRLPDTESTPELDWRRTADRRWATRSLWREILGNVFGFASAIGGLRRRVWAWPVGIVGNVLLFSVFIAATFERPPSSRCSVRRAGRCSS